MDPIMGLNALQHGMTVCIDGRTVFSKAEYDSGMAVPGYLAKAGGRKLRPCVTDGRMICNF